MPESDTLLFVYGTLLEGESNHALLAAVGCKAADAAAAGTLWDTGRGYPALSFPEQGRAAAEVRGELYRIPSQQLAVLDILEDYYGPGDPRNEYERVAVTVRTAEGPLRAWTYLYPPERLRPGLRRIEDGNWRGWRQREERRAAT